MQSSSKSTPLTTKRGANSNGVNGKDAPSSARSAATGSAAAGSAAPIDVRDALAAAVVAWWQRGALPSDALLQKGLLALESGVSLEPSQRTLLARTALTRGHGIITALKHVNDAERVASLVHEAWSNGLLDEPSMMSVLQDDRLPGEWRRYLVNDLRADLPSITPGVAVRAEHGLALVAGSLGVRSGDQGGAYDLVEEDESRNRMAWYWMVAAALLAVALAAAWYWTTRLPDYGDVIAVAAGTFDVTDTDGAPTRAALGAFQIDRTEVTNRQYSDCYGAGKCPYPSDRSAPGRDNYFLDSAFATHPVANVSWDAANAYCTWRGMRLPSAAEFEVSALFAPLTNRMYTWPWGASFNPALVIGGGEHEGTAPVASRSPQGDSPLGVADLSGNVAEWTSTFALDAPQLALVKGGSWRDDAEGLNPAASLPIARNTAQSTIGFRCAADGE